MNINQNKEQVTVTAYSFIIAVLCMLAYAVSFISRNVWSTSIAVPGTLESLGITALDAGGLMTAFYVGYVSANFLSGFIVDKFGPKLSLAFAAAGTGVFTLIIPFCNSYALIFILRILAGIASGPLFAGVAKMNYGWFDNKRRGVAVGFMMSGVPVGGAIAAAVFAPIIQHSGWRYGFVLAGIIAIIIGVLILILGKEKGLALATYKLNISKEQKQNETKRAIKIFMQKDFIIGCIMHFFTVGAVTGMTTWILAYFVNVHKLTVVTAGLIFGASQFLGLITGITAGIVSDLLKTRKWLVFGSGILAGILTWTYTLTSDVAILTTIAVLSAFIRAGLGTGNNIMQTERAKSPEAGKVMGWFNAVVQLGSVIYPTVAGAILTFTGSYFGTMMFFAGSLVVAGILSLAVKDTYVKKNLTKEA